jgi:hypothetical protein
MPIFNAVGYSTATIDKEAGLEAFLFQHVAIVKRVVCKYPYYPHKYYYIDTNAGDGKPGEMCDGSPLVFLKSVKDSGLPYEGHFIEQDQDNVSRLGDCLSGKSGFAIHQGDNQFILPRIISLFPKYAFGLIYCDPNYMDESHFQMIAAATQFLPKIDVLIRYSAAAAKRNGSKLPDYLRYIKKSTWIVRRALNWDKWQWTFLFGSNYSEYKAWEDKGFYRTDGEIGRKILDRIIYTREELARRYQLSMFDTPRQEAVKRSGGL